MGDGRIPEGCLIAKMEGVQSSLRDSLAVAICARQFLPGSNHALPPAQKGDEYKWRSGSCFAG